MISNRKWSLILGAIMVAVLVLSACATPPATTDSGDADLVAELEAQLTAAAESGVDAQALQDQLATAQAALDAVADETEEAATEEPPTDRTGAWVDTVVVVEEPSADAAFARLESGDIDVHAFGVANPEILARVEESEIVDAETSYGSYNDLTFNNAGPELADGSLNPFASAAIRSAMNRLMDRNYIVEEIFGGLAIPRWHSFNGPSTDYALYAATARGLEAQYSYDKEAATEAITAEMEALGAEMDAEGKWTYNGNPVNIIILIRTEDERMQIGDYVANELESIGFTVTRDYKTSADAAPCWLQTDPMEGCFHIYTGGWVSTAVPRDTGANYLAFYTPLGRSSPLWQSYAPSEEFGQLAEDLNNNAFTTMDERAEKFQRIMELSLEESQRIWLVDRSSINMRRSDISVAADLYGGIYGSVLWPYTLRRGDEIGGSVTIAVQSILPEPWNPIGGSNFIYDLMLIRGMGEQAVYPDPFTGLNIPHRIERAEVEAQEGLPIRVSSDWVTLNFTDEIAVPEDAWSDWNAETQTFITAGERFPDGATALIKTTVYYPESLWTATTWHDGSPISPADFVMFMILTFDQGKEASPYYDESVAAITESFLTTFKGVKIVSTDPLIIETYSDTYGLDAENSLTTWFPFYGQGSGAWHNLALGLLAEEQGEAAFSASKADAGEVEYMSFIAGPSIEILSGNLTEATEANWVPYAATLEGFMGDDEVATRYANLGEFFRQRGHFWLGTGPFSLRRAFPVEGTVILDRYDSYPDPADRYAGFSAPAIADVVVDGPGNVVIGEEATYTVDVTFNGEPYAAEDIDSVSYLVFDAEGNIAIEGVAEGGEGGLWTITLTPEQTEQLAEGSNRLEVIVVSKRVAFPSFATLEFVTTP